MKAFLHAGEEDWIHETTGDPVVVGYGGGTWELTFPTKHGPLEVLIEPGEPAMTQNFVDELAVALRERFEERLQERTL